MHHWEVQAVLVVVACAAYLGTSSLLILLNKFLLSRDGFAFPLLLSGSGMLVTSIASSILIRFDSIVPEPQVRLMSHS
jgi:hypothetical protein